MFLCYWGSDLVLVEVLHVNVVKVSRLVSCYLQWRFESLLCSLKQDGGTWFLLGPDRILSSVLTS